MRFAIPRLTLPIGLLFLLCFSVVVVWFRNGYIIYFWDATFPLNPSHALHSYSSLWDFSQGIGAPNFTGFRLIPYIAILYIFNSLIELPLSVSEAMLYLLLLFGSSCGMYLFSKKLAITFKTYNHGKFPELLGLSAALFYMANLYSILFLWRIFSTALFLYLSLPYLFYFVLSISYNGLSLRRTIGLVIVCFLPSISDPALFPPLLIFLLAFVIMIIVTDRLQFKRMNWSPLTAVISLLVVNLFWILPLGILSSSPSFSTSTLYGGTLSALEFNSKFSDLLSVATLRGGQILHETYLGQTDYSWVSLYIGNGLIGFYLISFLILVFVAFAFFFLQKKLVAFFGVFALIFGFLVKGVHPPLGNLYLWFFENTPFSSAYRDPYAHFGLYYTFCLSILFAIGLATSASELQRRMKSNVFAKYFRVGLIVVILSLVCGVYAWPFWTGSAIPQATPRDVRPAASIQIPTYYYQASDYLLSHAVNGSKVLVLPFQSSPLESSLWGNGYVGLPIIRSLTCLPVIFGISGSYPQDNLSTAITNDIQQNLSSSFFLLLSNMGVKYVIVDESTNRNFDPSALSYIQVEQFMNRSDSVNVVARFGSLLIYQMKSYDPLFFFSNYDVMNLNQTNINISEFQPGYGSGRMIGSDGDEQMYCNVQAPSDYCNFDLVGINYSTNNYPYFAIRFSSINGARLEVSFSDSKAGFWPAANSSYTTTNNVYFSNSTSLLMYDLSGIMSSLNGIHLHVAASQSVTSNTTVGINVIEMYLARAESLPVPKSMQFEESGASKYTLHIENASSPFVVVFDETFDPSWIASSVYSNGTTVTFSHYIQNGFQNAWYVNRTGTFNLVVTYLPQGLVYPSTILTILLTFVLFCSVIFLTLRRRSKYAKNQRLQN